MESTNMNDLHIKDLHLTFLGEMARGKLGFEEINWTG